jgi:hypothetical protein
MEAGMTKTAITGAAINGATIRKIVDEAFAALNRGGGHVLPFSTRYPGFGMDDAYRVTAIVNKMRVAQRYKPLGRKILPRVSNGGPTTLQHHSGHGSGCHLTGYARFGLPVRFQSILLDDAVAARGFQVWVRLISKDTVR